VCHVKVTFGKTLKNSGVENLWKKKLIFFELPYWSKLDVENNVDEVHATWSDHNEGI